jgi:uncharacterized protein
MLEKDKYKDERIDFELYKKIIDKIIKQKTVNRRKGETVQLVFHGGEALMIGKEKLYKIAEYATTQFKKHNIDYSLGMQSNITLLDDEFAKILNKFEINVGISFDGIGKANQDRTDIKQTIFEQKFDILNDNKVNYGFLAVANKNNVDHFDKTTEYLKDLGDGRYKVNYAEDMINPGENSEIEISGDEMFDKVYRPEIDKFIEKQEIHDGKIEELLNDGLADILTYHEDGYRSGCGGKFCGAAIGMIGVNPDGDIHFCDRYAAEYPETFVQNALDYDFLGIHQQKKAIEFQLSRIEVVKQTGCDTCYAQHICEYGCTAMYYSKYGVNGIEENIVCSLYKKSYDYILSHLDDIIESYVKANKPINAKYQMYDIKKSMKSRLHDKGYTYKNYGDSLEIKEISYEESV